MTKTFLKMKIGGLAAEARIIKREEQKWRLLSPQVKVTYESKGDAFRGKGYYMVRNKRFPGTDHPLRLKLHEHRVCKVRPEIRASLLAYGFLRGRSYLQVENKTLNRPDWLKVWNSIKFHGDLPVIKGGDINYDEALSALKQRFAEWIDNSGLPTGLKPYVFLDIPH